MLGRLVVSQCRGQPVEMIRLRVKQELQRKADDDQRGGHRQRPDKDFGGQRQPPERRARTGLRAQCESGLHRPDGQGDANPVEAAAKEIRQAPFAGQIEQETVGDAEDEPREQRRGDKSALPRGAPQKVRNADLRRGSSGPNGSLRSPALLIVRRHRDSVSIIRSRGRALPWRSGAPERAARSRQRGSCGPHFRRS